MKKITAIIIFLCLFFTVIGYHFVFHIHLNEIKTEMKQRLRSSSAKEVQTLVFNEDAASKIDWENDNEFRFNNEMYDVIGTQQQGKDLLIRCIADIKENELLEAYQNINTKNSGSPTEISLIKLLSTPFVVAHYNLPNRPQLNLSFIFFYHTYFLPAGSFHSLERPPIAC